MMYRRSFLKGLGALFVAPAIIRVENLMPIKEYMPAVPAWCPEGWLPCDGREISKKFYPDLYAALERMRLPLIIPGQETQMHHGSTANVRNVISYKDLRRPNGTIMRAGVYHPIFVPENMA